MSNFEFLRKYFRLQKDIKFDEELDFDFALAGYSLMDQSVYWNSALTNQILDEVGLSKIEEFFRSKQRISSVYFEKTEVLNTLVERLVQRGYKKEWEDCWQFWNNGKIDPRHFENIKKVETPEDLQTFLKTFDASYQKDDPQNPYGELGDYLRTAEDAWYRHKGTGRLEYFVVYDKDRPVAVSSFTNFEGLGYISNVGSLREVRGKGFGKAATLFCVDQSMKNGNREHCLATEEGAYPDEFYKRIGFVTRFRAEGYTKK